MSFRVGQKVECVDASTTPGYSPVPLTEGAIYTVRWVGDDRGPRGGGEHIRLAGVVRRGRDMPFIAYRFRPVADRPTDISIFTKMLTDTRIKESA